MPTKAQLLIQADNLKEQVSTLTSTLRGCRLNYTRSDERLADTKERLEEAGTILSELTDKSKKLDAEVVQLTRENKELRGMVAGHDIRYRALVDVSCAVIIRMKQQGFVEEGE